LDAGPGALVDRPDEPPGLSVVYLGNYTADPSGHDRPSLPERLGHRQPEPLPDRLLDERLGVDLEGVHLDRTDVVHVAQDVDVRIAVGMLDRAVVVLPALRVVVRHRADE